MFTLNQKGEIVVGQSPGLDPRRPDNRPGPRGASVPGAGGASSALPPGVTQAMIDASIAANPQASKGGYEGVGTPEHPGPEGQTSYGTTTPDNTGTGSATDVDYSSFLGIYGLPPELIAKINEIFSKTPDVNQATQLALGYVRGTPWYAKTYPGIKEGIARGVIGNESDYRNYVNGLQQLTHQYYGRDVSGDEVAGYLGTGWDVTRVGKSFASDAFVNANRGDIQYAAGAFGDNGQFSADDLKSLGDENSGLDSAHGQAVLNAYNKAIARMHGVFQGVLANPSLSLGPNGLSAPSLGGTRNSETPDVSA